MINLPCVPSLVRRGIIWTVLPLLVFTLAPPAFSQSEDMILIPAGEFQMGSKAAEDETPHTVKLSAFFVDTFEVTQEQFEKIMRKGGTRRPLQPYRFRCAENHE